MVFPTITPCTSTAAATAADVEACLKESLRNWYGGSSGAACVGMARWYEWSERWQHRWPVSNAPDTYKGLLTNAAGIFIFASAH